MSDIALNWLRRESVYYLAQRNTISNTTVQVFPADPMRFVMTVRPHPTVDIYVGFGKSQNVAMTYMIPHASQSVVWSEDEYGDLVIQPMWGYTYGAAGFIVGFSCSYCPCKWDKYESIYKQSLGL